MRTPRKGLSPLRGVLLEGIETQYIRIKAQDAYYDGGVKTPVS